MKKIVSNGVPKEKLHMGVPFYGQSFTLQSSSSHQLGAPTRGGGDPGEYTLQRGMLAYHEICPKLKSGQWMKVAGNANFGPFAHGGDQWVGYDDVRTVERKAQYIVDGGFGGVALWTIDLDDFNNRCCHGASPLLNAASRILRGFSKATEGDCTPPEPVATPAPLPTDTTKWDSGSPDLTTEMPKPAYPVEPPAKPKPKPKPEHPGVGSEDEIRPAKPENCNGHGINQLFADPNSCGNYYHCVMQDGQGKPIHKACAPGLEFDGSLGICNWPELTECSSKKRVGGKLRLHDYQV